MSTTYEHIQHILTHLVTYCYKSQLCIYVFICACPFIRPLSGNIVHDYGSRDLECRYHLYIYTIYRAQAFVLNWCLLHFVASSKASNIFCELRSRCCLTPNSPLRTEEIFSVWYRHLRCNRAPLLPLSMPYPLSAYNTYTMPILYPMHPP